MKREKFLSNRGFRLLLFAAGFAFGVLLSRAVKAQDKSNSFLWEISGNGLKKPSFLFGTFHLICEDSYNFGAALQQALDQTEVTVMELDLSDPGLPLKLQQLSLNPGGENFSDHLSKEEKEAIDQYLKEKLGADLSQLGVYKPFALTAMMVQTLINCSTKSYEREIFQRALDAKKPILGLETAEFQMKLFDEVPTEKQVEWLIETLQERDEQLQLVEQMMKAHYENDLKELTELMLGQPEFKEYADLLLYQRNISWVNQLEDMIKERSALIAVGAGHLGADQGLIKLLEAKGYKLKAL